MSKKNLPGAPEGAVHAGYRSHLSSIALARWDSEIRAAASDGDDRSISIYDVIGLDYWTGDGVTAKRISGALRALGPGPVTVNVNSPGGDLFEGFAIYNMLREHDGEVTVKVLGLAASAGSVIAMAGDKIEIARAGFLMIHNTWILAVGNKNDMRAMADQLEPFDQAMVDIYSTKTGIDEKKLAKMMDAETWISGSSAVEQGFADSLLSSDSTIKESGKASAPAARRLESHLRASGLSKSEAMTLMSQFKTGEGDPVGSGEGDPTEFVGSTLETDAILSALKGITI